MSDTSKAKECQNCTQYQKLVVSGFGQQELYLYPQRRMPIQMLRAGTISWSLTKTHEWSFLKDEIRKILKVKKEDADFWWWWKIILNNLFWGVEISVCWNRNKVVLCEMLQPCIDGHLHVWIRRAGVQILQKSQIRSL